MLSFFLLPSYEYLWADKYKYKTPTSVPAKTYIDNLLNWVEHLFTDETLFPQEKDMNLRRV